jgi:elongation factor 3
MIKLLTGELKPSHGVVVRHPNLRFAYVAQHAFHHIEQHLDKTPNEYIRWRFNDGTDKEEERKTTAIITPEERAIMETPFEVSFEDAEGKKMKEKRVIEMLMGRRKEGKTLMYEVKFKGKSQDQNKYMEREELIERGFKKLVEEMDRKKLAQEGAYVRTLTQLNVQEHLEAVGLDAELGSHNRIRSLSGGQKVKVVLGAATWSQPHIIILDEPTNYLDREALGALGNAIKAFDGGVVLITHNQAFAEYTCRETWVVANNRCDIQGDPNWAAYEKEAIELGLDQPENFDAAGNTVSVETKRTPDSVKPRDKKAMTKVIKQKIIDGDEMTPFEEECCNA